MYVPTYLPTETIDNIIHYSLYSGFKCGKFVDIYLSSPLLTSSTTPVLCKLSRNDLLRNKTVQKYATGPDLRDPFEEVMMRPFEELGEIMVQRLKDLTSKSML